VVISCRKADQAAKQLWRDPLLQLSPKQITIFSQN
jgi:hypothetical protein